MSNYTKTTNFATKDNLSPGNPLKIVKGTEIDTEFNNIATAVATKTDNSAANITGGSITGITDLAVADGGTGASTATAALNNLLPTQTGNANKYLQTDGTNATWDAVSLSTADITGTLPVANGGTGVTASTGTGSVVLSNSPTLVTPALGTPASGTATNLTGLPISTGVSGLGTGVATFLGTPSSANLASAVTDETGSGALVFANSPTLVTPALGTPASGVLTNATGLPISTGVSGLGTGVATFLATPSSANLASAVSDETGSGALVFANSPTLVTPALGTPSALVGTNITGTASGLTAGNVTTNANLTGAVTSVGNATSLGSFSSANLLGALTDETGTGSAVFATSPTLVTPILGTPTSATLTNATGLPISTGVSGLGTGVATALAVNVGSSGAPLVNGGVLGTPSSGTVTNLTGTASININGTVGATTASTGAFTTLSATGVTTVQAGSAAAPAITTTGDTNTGIFFPAADTIAFTEGGTEAARFDSSGRLLIGNTASVADSQGFTPSVQVSGTSALAAMSIARYAASTAFPAFIFEKSRGATVGTNTIVSNGDNLGGISFQGANGTGFTEAASIVASVDGTPSASADMPGRLEFYTTADGSGFATERMRIDSSGNLGIGTSSPSGKLDITSSGQLLANFNSTNASAGYIQFQSSTTNYGYAGSAATLSSGSSTDFAIRSQNNLVFTSGGGSERARILSGGEVLINNTSTFSGRAEIFQVTGLPGSYGAIATFMNSTGTQDHINFVNPNGSVGKIQTSGSSTSYVTSSDYRLKNTIAPMTGVLAKVALLKPVTYKWNVDGSDSQGFIAHELAEVVPECVTGAKDEVDQKGNPVYQGIDTSFLVATLTAAIQEQQAIIESLKARLDAANL